jgi:hypothetical protein
MNIPKGSSLQDLFSVANLKQCEQVRARVVEERQKQLQEEKEQNFVTTKPLRIPFKPNSRKSVERTAKRMETMGVVILDNKVTPADSDANEHKCTSYLIDDDLLTEMQAKAIEIESKICTRLQQLHIDTRVTRKRKNAALNGEETNFKFAEVIANIYVVGYIIYV